MAFRINHGVGPARLAVGLQVVWVSGSGILIVAIGAYLMFARSSGRPPEVAIVMPRVTPAVAPTSSFEVMKDGEMIKHGSQ